MGPPHLQSPQLEPRDKGTPLGDRHDPQPRRAEPVRAVEGASTWLGNFPDLSRAQRNKFRRSKEQLMYFKLVTNRRPYVRKRLHQNNALPIHLQPALTRRSA